MTKHHYVLIVLLPLAVSAAFVSLPPPPSQKREQSKSEAFFRQQRRRRTDDIKWQSQRLPCLSAHGEDLDLEIKKEIQLIAQDLWEGTEIPTSSLQHDTKLNAAESEGEAKLENSIPFSQRGEHFKSKAIEKGCPKAQHSYGLLSWSGFGGVQHDAVASAKFHAAAASQNHLDGMAVLGGCLRTGSGVKTKNVALGLDIIEYCASRGNPTGINKKAALLETNQDYHGAVKLYEQSLERGRVNALLLFNLGWCLMNGQGVDRKDVVRGISLWKEAATALAPDEGSEEAAWYLYEEYKRDNPKEAERWLDAAIDLGYCDDDIDMEREKELISNINSSW